MHLEAITSRQREMLGKFREFPQFYMAEGTALVLQIGHRISVDFDFFSRKKLPTNLLSRARRIFSDFKIKIVVNHSE